MLREPGPAGIQVVHHDAALRITVSKNLQINVWTDAPTLAHLRLHAAQAQVMHRAHPDGTGLVNIMVRGTPKFTDGVRDEAVRLRKMPSHYTLGTAHVVLVTGLAGAAVRAFMGTVILMARSPTPSKVFGDIDSAVRWFTPILARGRSAWTAADLADTLNAVAAEG